MKKKKVSKKFFKHWQLLRITKHKNKSIHKEDKNKIINNLSYKYVP